MKFKNTDFEKPSDSPISERASTPQNKPAPKRAMYCLQCGYDLAELPARQCPECGPAFDPDNLHTFAASGRGEPAEDEVKEFTKRMALWIAFVLFAVATALGWLIVYLWPMVF